MTRSSGAQFGLRGLICHVCGFQHPIDDHLQGNPFPLCHGLHPGVKGGGDLHRQCLEVGVAAAGLDGKPDL